MAAFIGLRRWVLDDLPLQSFIWKMSIRHLEFVVPLGACWVLGACAPSKPEEPAPSVVVPAKVEPVVVEVAPPLAPAEGMRVGNLLGLPEERETHSTTSGAETANRPGRGTVTVTPPAPSARPPAPPKPPPAE